MSDSSLRIAVVGGGVAGITAAHILSRRHQVTLFEKNSYVGGHTNTVVIDYGPDAGTAVDTGFIVLNDKNYPLFHRLLSQLDVAVRWSDMSFSYYCEKTKFQYAGRNLNSLIADRSNLIRGRFWRLLKELIRFCREASRSLGDPQLEQMTIGQYLTAGSYGKEVIEDYILPMGAAIWSSPRGEIMQFPAASFLQFFSNHGLLSLVNRPRWQTVVGGSQSYVQSFLRQFPGEVYCGAEVVGVLRSQTSEHRAEVVCEDGRREVFDRVIIAAHADQALAMLERPTAEEQRLLGAWNYSQNHTVLHTASSLLPPSKRAWASWNYVRIGEDNDKSPVFVSYWMNLLQGLSTASDYLVTLNYPRSFPEESIIKEINYTHPIFSLSAIRSQGSLPTLNGSSSVYFCGSYFGYGFHEDAVASAVAVAKHFEMEL